MRLTVSSIATAILLSAAPGAARAQAFVEGENSLSMGLSYTYAPSGKLLMEDSFEIPNIKILAHTVSLDVEYDTPVPGLAVDGRLDMVGVKLGSDSFPHFPSPGPYDDGDFHFTPTDLRAGLRYQIKPIEKIVGLSLVAAGSIPTHDYPTFGLTAPGHGLKAFILGANIARTFDPLLPRLFVAGTYEYAFREKVDVDPETEKFPRNFSSISAQLGYFITDRLEVDAAANWRISHGGATFLGLTTEPMVVLLHHDQLLDEDFFLVGGDVGYQITDELGLAAGARIFVSGENTRNQNLFGISAHYLVF